MKMDSVNNFKKGQDFYNFQVWIPFFLLNILVFVVDRMKETFKYFNNHVRY